MNKKSWRVWLILACLIVSTLFLGDNVAANLDDDYFKNLPQSDDTNADANSEADSEQASATFGIFDYVKVLLALAFVLGLLLFVLKFLNKKNSTYQQNNMLQNLGGISVGQQKSVQVIKAGDRILIVGVGDNIEVLTEITEQQEVDRLIDIYESQYDQTVAKPYFMTALDKLNGNKKQQVDRKEEKFGNILNKRLGELKKERKEGLDKWKDKENDER